MALEPERSHIGRACPTAHRQEISAYNSSAQSVYLDTVVAHTPRLARKHEYSGPRETKVAASLQEHTALLKPISDI